MNKSIFQSLAFIVTLALFAGCEPHPDESTPETVTAVPEFSLKRGLLLPEQTRRSLDLKIVDVTERVVNTSVTLQLRVYDSNSERLLASGTVTAEKASLLHAGQSLDLQTADGKTGAGSVTRITGGLRQATGAVEVLVESTGLPEGVAVGDFLKATAHLSSGEKVVTIPQAALLGCSEGEFVYTVSGEHLVRTSVTTGASDGDWVEIKDGLYEGDRVALQPVMSLWMTELAAVKGGQACCLVPGE